MSDAQNWTLLGMVTVLIGVIGGLLVHQIRSLGDRFDGQIRALGDRLDARLHGFESTVDARFQAVDRRFDHLDGDVQAIARAVFTRD